ncbi:MAG: NAD(P)-dependent dehydrogenase (short-subunit alcohol dehydrogenase family) [Paraglaciecola sp.]|jgi:NAD(P)-dependent dehydrogenase (short-subunit alcohol dehydrogenase family)
MDKVNALIIGVNGALGGELLKQINQSARFNAVHAISRTPPSEIIAGVNYQAVDSTDEHAVAEYCRTLAQVGIQFSLVVCCVGVLHNSNNEGVELKPEKRLEDINAKKLAAYFAINTIIPAIWLKSVEPLLLGGVPAKLVFFGARVGSIEDNKLGGWYGYRASKAGLNMLLKTAQIEYQRRAPNVSIVCYHPGTVDSALSKPFQANVPKSRLFSAEFSIRQLLTHLKSLHPGQEPHFIDWQGKNIPW